MKASLRGFTCCVPDAKEGGIVIGTGVNEPGEIKGTSMMEQAYEMGKGLI